MARPLRLLGPPPLGQLPSGPPPLSGRVPPRLAVAAAMCSARDDMHFDTWLSRQRQPTQVAASALLELPAPAQLSVPTKESMELLQILLLALLLPVLLQKLERVPVPVPVQTLVMKPSGMPRGAARKATGAASVVVPPAARSPVSRRLRPRGESREQVGQSEHSMTQRASTHQSPPSVQPEATQLPRQVLQQPGAPTQQP
mmetsp:Transcript_102852/g.331453  ORF Transcript_102852/g.331453 Transcript_102852/m.331453 type:complete len:200 (+) Transcript_102852:464-1063(+)